MRRRFGVVGVLVAALGFSLALPSTASALRLKRVAGGFDQLTQVTAPRSGDRAGALYVVEQEGQIWRRHAGTRRLFLDIRATVLFGGEQGLLSMAFDPSYASNRLFYVYYTSNSGDIRVARYRANSTSTRGKAGSRRVILRISHPGQSNHNGGQLAFGPNGRLYAATGDGGGSCDPNDNAQDLRSRLGKLLSVDPKRVRAGWRIDGYGLRNPWRFSFDRRNGRLYIGDVGQGAWEEVSTRSASALGRAPENYGWDTYEGRARASSSSGCDQTPLNPTGRLVRPIHTYSLGGARCVVTGGFAYRGSRLPSSLRGWYFFADYCTGEIWRLRVGRRGRLAAGPRRVRDSSQNITSFGEGVRGALFVATAGGAVYKLARS